MTLAGRVIAVTRPAERAGALAAALEALGATVLACPAIEVAPPPSYDALDAALLRLAEYDWLALTSVAAVAAHWGFAHLGRFATEYRRRFGIYPSQTLRA